MGPPTKGVADEGHRGWVSLMMALPMMGLGTAADETADDGVADNAVADADDDAGDDGCHRRWAPCTLGIAWDCVADDVLADAMGAGDDGYRAGCRRG